MTAAGQSGQSGTIIVVVGPSGAGKDSVIDFAMRNCAGRRHIHLVRRVITRPQDAGGEDHEGLSDAEFEARQAAGAFVVSWEAHGLKYGIPADVQARIAGGETLIANGSRRALPSFRQVFPKLAIVNITASKQALTERLMTRGRETQADILKRLERQVPDVLCEPDVITIDNSGPLAVAGTRFSTLVLDLHHAISTAATSEY